MASCTECVHVEVCKDYIKTVLDDFDDSQMCGDDCEFFQDRSRFDDFPNKRLTTNEPQGNFENLMNYAYDKNSHVTLRYGAGKYDIDLAFYVFQESDEYVCPARSVDDIMEGTCFECENNCSLGILYSVATQAAELRARLKMYEDLAEQALKERDRE